MVDASELDDQWSSRASFLKVGAQFTFLSLSWSIFDQFSNFFFLLKAYDFISAFLVGAQNSLAQKTDESRTWWMFESNLINWNNLDFFLFSLGGHAYPRCLVYEPKTPPKVYQKSAENGSGYGSLFIKNKKSHDTQGGFSVYEFDSIWFNCGHVGCTCGEFILILVYFRDEKIERSKHD